MALEFYNLIYTGKRLERILSDKPGIQCSDSGTPPAPWELHSSLGDDANIWCEVYRIPNKPGAFFAMMDYEELLFVAHAQTNMAFTQALCEFSKMVTEPRYAADIFEDDDSDDFDD